MDKEIVLLTGASSGIGRAVAVKLADARHTVVITGRAKERLAPLEKELSSRARRVLALPADLTREEEVRHLVEESLKTFGTVHALVHCAGWGTLKPLQETTPEAWRRTLDTNLTSLFLLTRALLPHFLRRGHGHVVALSSVAGRHPFRDHAAYCASKFGLMGMLGALRAEVRGKGVTVTSICPGPTDTPFWEGLGDAGPRGGMLRPETVADAVLFALGQPESACVEELVLQPAGGPA